MSKQMTEGRQGMAKKMGQGMGQGMGNQGMAQQYQRMIEQWKRGMGGQNGGQGKQGQAQSGWGLGTSPYAVGEAPAAGENQVEDRQGDKSLGDTVPTDFEALYAPEDYAHAMSSENQLHGQLDLTQAPEKIEEVRSAPETQEAMAEYADVIGAYQEGDESAINLGQIPPEYQQLVLKYIDQLNDQSGSGPEEGSGEPAPEDEDGDS